jgi:hypothetical protein
MTIAAMTIAAAFPAAFTGSRCKRIYPFDHACGGGEHVGEVFDEAD